METRLFSREQKDTALRQLLRSGRVMKLALEHSFRTPRPGLCPSPLRPIYRPATVLPHPVTVHLSRRSSADTRESIPSEFNTPFLTQPKKLKVLRPITHERAKSHMSATARGPWVPKSRFAHMSLRPDFRVTIVHVEDVFAGKLPTKLDNFASAVKDSSTKAVFAGFERS